ncbi:uncharacterized protein LOC112212349 isoform X2 [Bombus impatiens]|uniref:Uncharacterized protein LOC112212349 isoform X2 n=1 Tax=Bombus impatiens TaxID=132113 RepID=A0A6P8KX27_BOMIM|nr:uncharacterized protein LOC112212349 isoform X2 [Bombus impatiens]
MKERNRALLNKLDDCNQVMSKFTKVPTKQKAKTIARIFIFLTELSRSSGTIINNDTSYNFSLHWVPASGTVFFGSKYTDISPLASYQNTCARKENGC